MRVIGLFITSVLVITGLSIQPMAAQASEVPAAAEIPTDLLTQPQQVSQIQLTTDQTADTEQETVKVTAQTDADVSKTNDVIEIKNADTKETVQTCDTGTECVYEYQKVDFAEDATFYSQTTNYTSDEVIVLNDIPELYLYALSEEMDSWDDTQIFAELTQPTTQNRQFHIVRLETGEVVKSCDASYYDQCMTFGGFYSSDTVEIKTYQAFIADDTYPQTIDDLTGIVATSNIVTINRTPWSLTLKSDSYIVHDNESFWIEANTNQNIPNNYYIYMYNKTKNEFTDWDFDTAIRCMDGLSHQECYVDFAYDTTQQYIAYLAVEDPNITAQSSISDLQDVKAVSNTITIKQLPWQLKLQRIQTHLTGKYSFTGTVNQRPSSYVSALVDKATGRILEVCHFREECSADPFWASDAYPKTGFLLTEGVSFVVGRWSEYPDTIGMQSTYSEPEGYMYDIQRSVDVQLPTVGAPVGDSGEGTNAYALTNPMSLTGGSNPSEPCANTCVADPINTLTGEFWLEETDLATQSSSPLNWTRYYGVSKRNIQGSLGYGWSTEYDMHLQPEVNKTLANSNTINISQENGSITTFIKNNADEWVSGEKTTAEFEETNNTFILTRKDGTRFTFNQNGQLTSIQDRNSNTLNLNYTNNKLSTITNNKGQTLTVAWNTAGLISSVTTSGGRTTEYTYNTAKELTTVTFNDGTTNKYTYDATHSMLTLTDENNNTTTNVYDSEKRVTKQTDPLNNATNITYHALRTEVQHPNGRVDNHHYNELGQVYWVQKGSYSEYYEFDAANNITLTTYPDGGTTQNTYDVHGNVLQNKDRAGNITTYTYNNLDQPLTITNPAGKTQTFTYDIKGNLTGQTDYNGNTTNHVVNTDGTVQKTTLPNTGETTYTYNPQGLTATITNPSNNTVTLEYSTDGELTSQEDALGDITEHTYNNVGQITAIQHPNNHSETFTYDANGNPLTETNRLGHTTTYTYDKLNRTLTVKDPRNKTITNKYDNMGNLVEIKDQLGNATTQTYDTLGNLTQTKTPGNQTITYSYNNMYQLTSVTDRGRTTSYGYDANGNLTETINPTNVKTRTSYNNLGLVTKTVDNQSKNTTYTHDDNGNLLTVTRPDLSVETYTYNTVNQPLTYTDGDGGTKTWTYNTTGQTTAFTNTDNTVTTYTYDANGNTLNTTRPDNTQITYEYEHNQVIKETLSDAVTEYQYNNAGFLIQEKQDTDIINYTYDANGNLTNRGPPAGNNVTYTYTDRNEVASLQHPSGLTTNYTYDANGNLTTAVNAETGTYTYTYNTRNQLTNAAIPNGVTQTFTSNLNNQITETIVKGTENYYDKDYTYNTATGALERSVTNLRIPVRDSFYEDFTYDNRGRLNNVDTTDTTAGDYTYSANGNLTNNFGNQQTFNTGNQLTETPTHAYGFDGRGNRTTATTTNQNTTYEYNQANKLVEVDTPNTTVAYTYDANGLLKERTKGTNTEEFVWDYQNSIPLLLEDDKYEYIYTVSNTPAAQINKTTNEVTYLHTDALGSVVTATKANKTQAAVYLYGAYGETENAGTTDDNHTVTRFGYAGEWLDEDTGLYNLRARWYEPQTGTFLNRDPLEQNTNEAYGYASGNPLIYTDPLGLMSQEWKTQQAQLRGVHEFGLPIHEFMAREEVKTTLSIAVGVVSVVGIAACTAATVGICGGAVGSALVVGGIGVTAGTLDYAITEGCPEPAGYLMAAAVGGIGGGKGNVAKGIAKTAAPGLTYKAATDNIMQAATKVPKQGNQIIYLRTHPTTNQPYVGKTNNLNRRSEQHDAKLGVKHRYKILGATNSSDELARMEEFLIRSGGGPARTSNPHGVLANKVYARVDHKYDNLGGDY